MVEITKAQEEILKVLWEIKEGAVSDILKNIPDPKPAYNTVATVIKVLEKKEYVAHRTYANFNVYYPIISKKEYAQHILKDTFSGLFNSSLNQLVSTFVKNKETSLSDLEELKEMLEKEIKNKKQL